MKALGALALAVLVTGGTPGSNAGTVYLDDALGQLWAGDPTTANCTPFCLNQRRRGGLRRFTDIDFVTLYGLDPSGNLYTVNQSTGQIIS